MERALMTNLKNELLREVGALARSVHAICDIKFRDHALQKGQFIFLTRICEHPGINFVDLSNMLKVDKTTTSKVVQKLITEGYIQKTRDEGDQRMRRLAPLPKALEIYPHIIDEENRNIDACLQGFHDSERAKTLLMLRRMRENIEERWKTMKN